MSHQRTIPVLACLLTILVSIQAFSKTYDSPKDIPNPNRVMGGFLADPDGYLDEGNRKLIHESLLALEADCGPQFCVVIVQSIGNNEPRDFANRLFNAWGIGSKERDDGLLLLLVMGDRTWTVEVGLGLEGIINDAKAGRFAREHLVPHLKAGSAGSGIVSLAARVRSEIARESGKSSCAADSTGIAYEPSEGEGYSSSSTSHSSPSALPLVLGVLGTIFLGGISGIFVVTGIFNADSNGGFVMILIGAVVLILAVVVSLDTRSQIKAVDFLPESPYEKYIKSKGATKHLLLVAFLLPALFCLLRIQIHFLRRKYRYQERLSPERNYPMKRLSEEEDDNYLSKGQISEEIVKSKDYDVWITEDKEETLVLAYDKAFTKYRECPECKFKTFSLSGTEILQHASDGMTGKARDNYVCINCSHRMSEIRVISASSSSSGSSSSSRRSSSGRSSSFGGGRSSGGGASGRW